MIPLTHAEGGAFLLGDSHPDRVFTPEDFTAESRMMARTAEEFLAREVLPKTAQIEQHDTDLMACLMRQAGELGLLAADVPVEYGGLGLDVPTGALLAEKLNPQQSFALTHEAHSVIAVMPLLLFGSHEQKLKYLPKLASGEWLGSFCLSEPDSGSDALSAQTKAVLDPDGETYVLNGTKMWITNAAFADLFTVFAKVDGSRFTAFLVERGTPGLSLGPEEHKLGMKGTSTRRVMFDNVGVPVDNRLGAEGTGHYAAFCTLNLGRFKLEAGAVGGLKALLRQDVEYAKQRKQFGRPIAEFGQIQHKIAEIAARTFVLESAVYRLAGMLDERFSSIDPTSTDAPAAYHAAAEEYSPECGIVKVFGSELYSESADESIQIHGGYGYTEEFPPARAWRDQRLLRIGEGANEVVRLNLINTLIRRGSSGRIDLGDATKRALALTDADFAPDSEAGTPWNRLKTAALVLLHIASSAYGQRLPDEQEVVACIADIVIAAFVVESAALRMARMAARRVKPDILEIASIAADIVADQVLASAHIGAHTVMTRVAQTKPIDSAVQRLVVALFFSRESPDVIGLRRQLAKRCCEAGGYPWD